MDRVLDNLEAAGFKPEDIDAVLRTHLHPDHACGLTTPKGKTAFPNATVWASSKDADFRLNNASAARLPEGQRSFVKMAQEAVAPYSSKGRFKTFKDRDAIVPVISVVPSNGHTPAHASYLVSSGLEKLTSDLRQAAFCQKRPVGLARILRKSAYEVIAAINAFLFVALAAMLGSNASSAQTAPRLSALLILVFVARTSLLMGITFGRTALRVTTISGSLALFMMWLSFQYCPTEESSIRSATALLLIIFAQIPLFFIGGLARACVEIRLLRVN